MPPALTGGDFALAESGAIVGVPAVELPRHLLPRVLRVSAECLLTRYGQKREQPSEAARVDDLYCNICVQCTRYF